MIKRSPRYPRQSLATSLEMVRKLFNGVHQAKVDVDTAAKLIGYAGSGGGAASSAIGSLRQFGLVDGLRGDVAVSELALRILQPMNDEERIAALREAAAKPEIFGRIIAQFGGRLPAADEPIRAFLIRQEGFSTGGANELIKSLRDTVNGMPEAPIRTSEAIDEAPERETSEPKRVEGAIDEPRYASPPPAATPISELISLPLGQGLKAEIRFFGEVTATSYARLIRHLELLRDMAAEEE